MESQQIVKLLLSMQAKMDANQERMETNRQANHEEMMAMLDANHERTMACPGKTEADTEKTEPDPGMMQSTEEHQEIPKGEAAMMPVGEPRKRRRVQSLAAERHQKWKERTWGKSWIQEEVGCPLQEGYPPCNSGMAQKKRPEKNCDPRKLWTAEYIDCRRNKDDPPCKSGKA
jgi:hypothetical protein